MAWWDTNSEGLIVLECCYPGLQDPLAQHRFDVETRFHPSRGAPQQTPPRKQRLKTLIPN